MGSHFPPSGTGTGTGTGTGRAELRDRPSCSVCVLHTACSGSLDLREPSATPKAVASCDLSRDHQTLLETTCAPKVRRSAHLGPVPEKLPSGKKHVRLRRVRPLSVLALTLLASHSVLSACATAQEQTGVPSGGSGNEQGGTGNASGGVAGTLSSSGGVAGTTQPAAGGTSSNAFGGTGAMPSGGSAGKGGTSAGGTGGASAGGTSAGGKGGTSAGGTSAGGKGGTSAGGTSAGGTSAGGSGGASSTCLTGWKSSNCDMCSTQTQGDLQACSIVLQCYEDNNCSPTTCGQPDQMCGQNKLGKGTAPYPVALQVYNCRCP